VSPVTHLDHVRCDEHAAKLSGYGTGRMAVGSVYASGVRSSADLPGYGTGRTPTSSVRASGAKP